MDGTLIDAWASMKSFRPRAENDGEDPPGPGRNAERTFRGEKRSNATHASATDPEARLYRKGNGKESRLCYLGHALMEHRHGLVVDGCVTLATGTAERTAALAMVERHRPGRRRITLAGDKGFDVASFVDDLRDRRVTPHLAVDGRVSRTRASGGGPGSTDAPRTTRVTGRASASSSGSRRSSVGSRSRAVSDRPGSRGAAGSRHRLSWPWLPAILSDYPDY